jgi:hypothetical protein
MGAVSSILMGLETFFYGNLFCKKAPARSFGGWHNSGTWSQDPNAPNSVDVEFGAMVDFSQNLIQ